jgi:DnaJ-class molecular chaperone
MTRATALELLELKEGATKAEMRKAYMRLMQSVHPDKGGSNYFAKQLNEAREVLGF